MSFFITPELPCRRVFLVQALHIKAGLDEKSGMRGGCDEIAALEGSPVNSHARLGVGLTVYQRTKRRRRDSDQRSFPKPSATTIRNCRTFGAVTRFGCTSHALTDVAIDCPPFGPIDFPAPFGQTPTFVQSSVKQL